ncbi:KLP1, partial [Symbiodinium microadriaticum]
MADRLQTFPLGIALLDGAEPLEDDSDLTSLCSEELQLLVSSGRPAVVVARVRPMSRREVQADEREAVAVTDKATLLLTDAKLREQSFTFDSVFDRGTPQQEVCQIIEPALKDALDGVGTTFVAFGARGAGKSFTLLGSLLRPDGPGPGWIPHFCQHLFARLQEEDEPYLIGVSMFSMHIEELRDLLKERGDLLRLKHGVEGVGLPDLSWHVASSPDHIVELLQQGLASIQVACTAMEIQSSEVSTFFQLHVSRFRGEQIATSTVRFVDLANSDRPSNPARRRILAVEALQAVVDACGRCGSFVPYRNSKLTQLLQPALCGPMPL